MRPRTARRYIISAVTALSEESIAKGGMPVAFPDFTNGAWCAYSVEE